LRCQRQPSRSATDDQNVDLCGNRTRCPGGRVSLRPVEDLGITRLKPIQVKLHDLLPSPAAVAAVRQLSALPGRPKSLQSAPRNDPAILLSMLNISILVKLHDARRVP